MKGICGLEMGNLFALSLSGVWGIMSTECYYYRREGRKAMQRLWHWLVLSLLLVSITACETSSGSATGGTSNCTRSGDRWSCTGTYSTLTGTTQAKFETPRRTDRSATVTVQATVGEGTVRVFVAAPDGTEQSATAVPATPAMLSSQVRASLSSFAVSFDAGEQTARDVRYTVEYTVP
jgi:hypothetical protein